MRDVSGLTRFLEQTPFFGGLQSAQLRGLVAMTVERTYEKGEFGDPARQAESLRQQMLSARNKLKLVERKREQE